MRKNIITVSVNFIIVLVILFTAGCSQPDSESLSASGLVSEANTSSVILDEHENVITPVMDIINNTISNVSYLMEYSLDNKATWLSCTGSVVSVTFNTGDLVWVRENGDAASELFLGEVKATSGPDLIPGKSVAGEGNWDDVFSGTPGETLGIMTGFKNIGNEDGYSSDNHFIFYISTDKIITSADTQILDFTYAFTCEADIEKFRGDEFIVPSLTPGVYYIGCVADASEKIAELNESNNTTLPENTAEFIIKDNTAAPSGAFKFVNSWGDDGAGSWENIFDGHYWVTYKTMKKQEMMVRYYYNNFSNTYEPTVIAVFQLTHDTRNSCKVILGLGDDPANPYMIKELQSRFNDDIKSGSIPFPDNKIVLDISEFAGAINDYNLFLKVENSSAAAGTIDNFSVEFYSDYDTAPFKTITGTTDTIPATGSVSVTAATAGSLTSTQIEQIVPQSRSTMSETEFIEEQPDSIELNKDKQSAGVYQPGKNYNKIVYGGFGTGDQPPSEQEWAAMKKLRRIDSFNDMGTLPNTIDNSQTKYFPPIGNQGSEGSCTCFSFGYYIQTYTEAKEHNWDLSGTAWLTTDPAGLSSGGSPGGNLDKIFSPDFIYHQINSGGDNGSSGTIAASLITRVGGATWAKMPYNTGDSTSWPAEAAWREAGRYRGRDVGNHYWDFISSGYFIIYDDSDINLLKSLLAHGYCVSVSIKADAGGLYDLLDAHDVADNDTVSKMSTNHAQTIVGYKEGNSWNPSNPDN